MEWLLWFTKFENTKPISLVIFFILFCGVVLYLYGSKKRGERIEEHKNIPLQDEENRQQDKQHESEQH